MRRDSKGRLWSLARQAALAKARIANYGHNSPSWELEIDTEVVRLQERTARLQEIKAKLRSLYKEMADRDMPLSLPHQLTKAKAKGAEVQPATRRPSDPPPTVRRRRAHGPAIECEQCHRKFRAYQVLTGSGPNHRKNRFCSGVCGSRWWRAYHKRRGTSPTPRPHNPRRGVTLIPGDPLTASKA